MNRVLRVTAVVAASDTANIRPATVHMFIDLGLKTPQLGVVVLTEPEATALIEKLAVTNGHVRRVNQRSR